MATDANSMHEKRTCEWNTTGARSIPADNITNLTNFVAWQSIQNGGREPFFEMMHESLELVEC